MIPADVQAARRRLDGKVLRTPLVPSEWLSGLDGAGETRLKLESLQATHSFKARGALNALLVLLERLPPGAPPPTVVTASAGNHGRALAWAAAQLGVRVVVFTPAGAPRTKLDAIRRHGADLRDVAVGYEDAERLAKQLAAESGWPFISAYSHPDLIAAIGCIALEVLEDDPGVERLVVPVGGGGLAAGIAATAKTIRPGIEIVGVEVEASHAFSSSLAAGRIVEVDVGPTLADGLAGNMDRENLAFPLVRDFVDRVEVVPESALRDAIQGMVCREHLVAEGAGAVGVAAAISGRLGPGRRTAIVVSGANIDTDKLVEILGGA
jgi:threonine dehydratase